MAKSKEPPLTRDQIMAVDVGGKTVSEWEAEWSYVEHGFTAEQPNLSGLLGLYRATMREDIMYIGRSLEINCGLQKRLRDYSRDSDSARDHFGAQKIMDNIDFVKCDVIVVGVDYEAQKNTAILKELMIDLHRPEWNVGEEAIDHKRRTFYADRSAK